MTRMEEIKNAVVSLPIDEYRRFRLWFLERDWAQWDKQIQVDSDSGKLDFLVKEAMDEKNFSPLAVLASWRREHSFNVLIHGKNSSSSFEKLRMAAEPSGTQFEIGDGVNEQPIGLQMAFTKIAPFPLELMVSEFRRQRFRYGKFFQYQPDLFKIASLSFSPFQVLAKLIGRPDRQHQLALSSKRSATLSYFLPLPALASSIACRVSGLGMRGSKGRPR